jgi:hypothetical protein
MGWFSETVLVIDHWDLEFICNLVLVIWDLKIVCHNLSLNLSPLLDLPQATRPHPPAGVPAQRP